MYSLHLECLAGQENGLIHTLLKRTSLVIPTASDLNYAYVGACPLAIRTFKKQKSGAIWFA